MATNKTEFIGNPFDPLGRVKIVALHGAGEQLLNGPLEHYAHGIWMVPGDETVLFNNRGVRVLDGRGFIHMPWTFMAVNY